MPIVLEIPESISKAMQLPEAERPQRLLRELAVTLYAQDVLSFGKARELAQLDKRAFAQLLGDRQIERHYTDEELSDDFTYARGQ